MEVTFPFQTGLVMYCNKQVGQHHPPHFLPPCPSSGTSLMRLYWAIEHIPSPHTGKGFYFVLSCAKEGWRLGSDLRSKTTEQIWKASKVQDGDSDSYNSLSRARRLVFNPWLQGRLFPYSNTSCTQEIPVFSPWDRCISLWLVFGPKGVLKNSSSSGCLPSTSTWIALSLFQELGLQLTWSSRAICKANITKE